MVGRYWPSPYCQLWDWFFFTFVSFEKDIIFLWFCFKRRLTVSFIAQMIFFKEEIDSFLFVWVENVILIKNGKERLTVSLLSTLWLIVFFFNFIFFEKILPFCVFFEGEIVCLLYRSNDFFFQRRGWPSPLNLNEIVFFWKDRLVVSFLLKWNVSFYSI